MFITTKITASLLAAGLLSAPAFATSAPFQVEVLDSLILNEPKVDGIKISELSSLAYDRDQEQLFSVSDKGRLFRFALDLTEDRLTALTPLSAHDLIHAYGARMSGRAFNPEGLALMPDATLAIVSEEGPRIAIFSQQGQWLEDIEVPDPLRDPAAQRSEKDGLESLTLHPDFGLLTAPEEPLAAAERTTHTIFATSGASFSYDTTAIGTTSIKGMETLPDGRLMILERDVSDVDGSLITWLRLLDPALCQTDQLCPTQVTQVKVPGISDADFEGLAQISDHLFLIVSDDKLGKNRRTVFALLDIASAQD